MIRCSKNGDATSRRFYVIHKNLRGCSNTPPAGRGLNIGKTSYLDIGVPNKREPDTSTITSITPFGATNGASEIVSLARAKLRRGTSN